MDGRDLLIRRSDLFDFRDVVPTRLDVFSELLLSISPEDSIG